MRMHMRMRMRMQMCMSHVAYAAPRSGSRC